MTTEAFLSLTRALPEPHVLVARNGVLCGANPAALRLLGLGSAVPDGVRLHDISDDPAPSIDALLARFAGGSALTPGALTLRDGLRLRAQGCALTIGPGEPTEHLLIRLQAPESAASRFLALNRSIDELTREARVRRRAEEEVRESELRARFLAEASRILSSSLEYEQTLRNMASMAVPDFADWCAVDVLQPDGSLARVAVEHTDPAKVRLAWELTERYPPDPDAEYGVHHALKTGRLERVEEIPEGLIESAAQDEEHLRMLQELALHSWIVAPLVAGRRVLGALTLVYAESRRRFGERDAAMVEDLARRAAVAIENARLVDAIQEARDRIAEQAGELEMQTEELQTQSAVLEEQAAEMEEQASELELQLEEVQKLNNELAHSNRDLEVARADAERAREAAEQASEAKSTFLAVMSHELRTPINAIMGYTDLLDAEVAGPLNDEQRAHLERVRNSSMHLVGLIDQILSLARIEAGHDDLHVEPADVARLARDAAAMIEPLASRRGLELKTEIPDGSMNVVTDVGKLTQILLNLLNNAVKFTEAGTIQLSLKDGDGRATFRVRDTGIGIPSEHHSSIFEPFVQVDQKMSRRAGGAGLGLSVSRQLARLLGGDITVESTPGEGSTFTISIPAAAGN
ncbi:MAG TPA: GAF domain-containing sensor histidine kinase [Longimicrobiales bacterium]|nr:GAF domain-containing sensor histidine kinase [Longimicrobiales bacterium]